jgi:hypothetical protein
VILFLESAYVVNSLGIFQFLLALLAVALLTIKLTFLTILIKVALFAVALLTFIAVFICALMEI